jgi:hypothetical protein
MRDIICIGLFFAFNDNLNLCASMKYWEVIADNLSKAGWSWGCVSAIDSEGRQSGLLMLIATTESVSLCMPTTS